MSLLFSWAERVLQITGNQMDSVLNRILTVPNSGYHYYWMMTFALFGAGFLFHKHGRSFLKKSYQYILSQPFRVELKKDIFFWSLRFIYKPVFFGLLGLNLGRIEKQLFHWAKEWGIGFAHPVVHLDPLIGSIVVGGLIFIVGDLISYLEHFLQHRLRFLWYFHMTHHFAESLNPLTKYRLHPVEYLHINVVPMLLKIPASLFIFKAFMVHGEGFVFSVILGLNLVLHRMLIHFRHSHIPIHYGFLSSILVSPVMHQVHHSRARKHFDKNIGVVFSFWDGIFGSLYIPKKDEEFNFGIKGYANLLVGRSYWFELKLPFILIARDLRRFVRKQSRKAKASPEEEVGWRGPYKASGFTLTEVLVSIMIFSMIALAAGTIFYNFAKISKNSSDINKTEAELDTLMSLMDQITSRAVNVRYFNGDLNGATAPPSGEGFVRSYRYEQESHMAPLRTSETLMFFARETARSTATPAALRSRFYPTGVFFVRKRETASGGNPRSSGKIVIDMGAGNANGVVRPDGVNDIVFDNVSDVVLDQEQYSKGNILLSMRMKVVMIYPLLSAKTGRDCYGPTRDIQANITCNTNATKQFKTVEKSIVLRFPNNKRDTPFSGAEFENGVYMFPPVRGK